jgi:hypothetical protein
VIVVEGVGQVQLGQSDEKLARLKTLKEMLWSNADKMQRADFDPLLNDHRLAVQSLQKLIQGVCHPLRIPFSLDSWKPCGVNICYKLSKPPDAPLNSWKSPVMLDPSGSFWGSPVACSYLPAAKWIAWKSGNSRPFCGDAKPTRWIFF